MALGALKLACRFNPEPLKKALEGPLRNNFELRNSLLLFRDDLIRILGTLRVKTISGTISVTNLAIGDSVDFAVDHTTDADFCLAEAPRFTVLNGVDVLIFAMIDIAGVGKVTNGANFCGRVTNVSIGGTGTGTFNLSWSRRGFP